MKLVTTQPTLPAFTTILMTSLAATAITATAQADVKLPTLFSPRMVLQRNAPIPIWGTADPDESITVRLGETEAKITAAADGRWRVNLPPRAAAMNLTLSVIGKNTLEFTDVAVGEVWICSGQSNMTFALKLSSGSEGAIKFSKDPGLRLFSVAQRTSETPLTDVSGRWYWSTPNTVPNFSAVAYFFGRELREKLGVPVGLIHTAWSGTTAESWTSRPMLDTLPATVPFVATWDKQVADYTPEVAAQKKLQYETETLPRWQALADKARADGKVAPPKPQPPTTPTDDKNRPANLFNGMIAPLMPYGIKGVIWYQGEANVTRANAYRALFPALIKDWRTRWGQGDFPFLWVQLANHRAPQQKPVEFDPRALLRDAQYSSLSVPNTGMATAVDLADIDNPMDNHPHNKLDVGLRLAFIALATQYGQHVPYSGPSFDKATFDGAKVKLSFKFTDGGLKVRGDKLTGFALKDPKGNWHWAEGLVEGDTVVLSSPTVPTPVAVRYNWAINPIGNLYNGTDLPALPFRTDTTSEQ
jgi:sialate O-acetylesterase